MNKLKTIEVNGEEVTNLYRDINGRDLKKQDLLEELFDDIDPLTGDQYGTPSLNKQGVLAIAEKLGLINDFEAHGFSGNKYTVQYAEGEEFRPSRNKKHFEKEIAEKCGFELNANGVGTADLFDIIYEIRNGENQ